MTKSSTLIYILNNNEDSKLIDVNLLDEILFDYKKVQKYLNKVKAPDLIVNNILEYSKKH